MPGKHAPSSPASFYLSLSRWGALALGVVGVLVAIVLVVTGGNGDQPSLAAESSPGATKPPKSVPSEAPTPTSKAATARKLSATTVLVLNGTNRSGLAGRVGDQLEEEGYKVVDRSNGPKPTEVTTIYYRSGWLAEARALRRKHPEMSKLVVAPARYAKLAGLTVLLGSDFP